MNATIGLRLSSQLFPRFCPTSRCLTPFQSLSRGTIPPCLPLRGRRLLWSVPGFKNKSVGLRESLSTNIRPSAFSVLREYSSRARPSPRIRRPDQQPPALPNPSQPTIANPITISGDEKEAIRYSDYASQSQDPESDGPPAPLTRAQAATALFVTIIGISWAAIYLLHWTPVLSAVAHAKAELTPEQIKEKYADPWFKFCKKWLFFSPAVALERLGYYKNEYLAKPKSESEEGDIISSITQFILPTFSHANIMHLAMNFFGLQALAPTMIRYYGFKRTLISYFLIGSLGLLLIIPYDRMLNPYTDLPERPAIVRYKMTDDTIIRRDTHRMPTKEQVEEHFKLGEHCRPALGGSGVLYGFLGITAIVNSAASFELMFIPVPISVRTLLMGLCALDLGCIGMRTEAWGTIGHLTGAAAGLLVWALWLRRVPLPPDIQRALMMRLRREQMVKAGRL